MEVDTTGSEVEGFWKNLEEGSMRKKMRTYGVFAGFVDNFDISQIMRQSLRQGRLRNGWKSFFVGVLYFLLGKARVFSLERILNQKRGVIKILNIFAHRMLLFLSLSSTRTRRRGRRGCRRDSGVVDKGQINKRDNKYLFWPRKYELFQHAQ